MAYYGRAIEVMIASPSDVREERETVREVISEWNTIHARDRKTILMPIGWDSHSIPDTGDRPQATINGQLLKEADLLIAILWTRIGSPTGVAESGTVEEIEEPLKAGKSAMIYFSRARAQIDTIDPSQTAALKRFKDSLQARGLYQEYADIADFREKLSRQLAKKMIAMATNAGPFGLPATTSTTIPVQPAPDLSQPAPELLAEAVRDRRGVIMRIGAVDHVIVQTNDKCFTQRGDARSEALWTGALRQLEERGLVEDRAGKRQVYFVTHEGFQKAEHSFSGR